MIGCVGAGAAVTAGGRTAGGTRSGSEAGMLGRDIVGVAVAIVALAALSVAIINGGQTATVITASGDAFANLIGRATHPFPANY